VKGSDLPDELLYGRTGWNPESFIKKDPVKYGVKVRGDYFWANLTFLGEKRRFS
jgi:hypothetical protein